MEVTNRDPSTLNRPEGNDLLSNYQAHDIAEEHVVSELEMRGLTVSEWGIDMRENDEALIYDDKMDMKVYDHHGELAAIVDVKSKRSDRWMGRYNLRHYRDYLEISQEYAVPVFVWMCKVDKDDTAVEYDHIIPVDIVDTVFKARDGNKVIEVAEWAKLDIDYLEEKL